MHKTVHRPYVVLILSGVSSSLPAESSDEYTIHYHSIVWAQDLFSFF